MALTSSIDEICQNVHLNSYIIVDQGSNYALGKNKDRLQYDILAIAHKRFDLNISRISLL